MNESITTIPKPTMSSPRKAVTEATDIPSVEHLSLNTEHDVDDLLTQEPRARIEERTTLYPKIKKLSDFIYPARRLGEASSIHLTGSVKLHGTHADIVFVNGTDEIRLQSRNQLAISVNRDNSGFAAFIKATDKKVILKLRDQILERYRKLNGGQEAKGDVVIAGEWCGTGIQKKVALTAVPRLFAIISIKINDSWMPDWEYGDICNEEARFFHISKAGFFTETLYFHNVAASEKTITQITDAIDKECPFGKALGVSGRGEGVVWKATKHCSDPELWFKSKGDLLAVSHSDKIPKDAVAKGNKERVKNFAQAIVTDNRLEQGWGYLDQKEAAGFREFLGWVLNDCLAEEQREMEMHQIDKGKLKAAIAHLVKPWFFARLESTAGKGE